MKTFLKKGLSFYCRSSLVMVGSVVVRTQQQKLSFVFGAKLLVLSFDFSSTMVDATTLHHKGSIGQPPIVAPPLDLVPTVADLSPTLSIKWCKLLLLFAMLCLTPYLLLLCLLDMERRMLKSILKNTQNILCMLLCCYQSSKMIRKTSSGALITF